MSCTGDETTLFDCVYSEVVSVGSYCYSYEDAVPTYNCYTEGQLSFGITDINCTGFEEHLVNCSHSNAVLYNCNSYDDAGVVCQGIN